MMYLLSDVDLGEEEAQAVADVVRSKWLSIGPKTEEFEDRFAEALRCRHAVALSNCTAALHLALRACGVGPGDEVLLPSYTFVATANAVLYQGATPVFVDITGDSDLNICTQDLADKITVRTKAIVVVHMAGYAADMDKIMAIAERYQLAVVEDACHAIGARYEADGSEFNGRHLGTIGNVGCFSFFANKNLVTGEGGMIVTNDPKIAEKVKRSRSHGMTKSSWDKASGRAVDYDVVDLGYNYRSTELTAALGLIQLRKLAAANAKRRELSKQYHQRLSECREVTLPFARHHGDSACHILPVLLAIPEQRAAFRERLRHHGVQTTIHYPPVHLFTQYREICPDAGPLPRTCAISAREVTLPLHPLLSANDVDEICSRVMAVLGEELAEVA